MGCRLNKLADFENDHANLTNLLEFSLPGGGAKQIVLKCYIGKGAPGRMSREFSALQWLIQRGILVPEPIFQDAKGVHLGKPCIIMTGYISGQCVMAPHNTQDCLSWSAKIAGLLVDIHKIPCPTREMSWLDANSEALWFLKSPSIPEYMRDHPDGNRVWKAISRQIPNLLLTQSVLTHFNYWSGNILWAGRQIAAIIDWEEAGCGDPAIDIAYCRMGMILQGFPGAADKFVNTCQTLSGYDVAIFCLFGELAPAVRPMVSPSAWINESSAKERYSQFVTNSIQQLS